MDGVGVEEGANKKSRTSIMDMLAWKPCPIGCKKTIIEAMK